MTVSVIIPAFNYGRFIERAVASIQAQSLTDWECVVVDDGSTDDTGDVVAAIAAADPRVRYMRQANSGLSASRNAGLRATTGEFVQLLDADDLIGPHKLERHAALLGSHPDVDLVYGDARYFRDATGDAPREEWEPLLPAVSGSGEPLLAALVQDNIMVVQAPVVRRSLLERVGGFDPALRKLEDWDCWLRCALAGASFLHDGGPDPDGLSYVRVHGTSLSTDQIAMHVTAVQVREKLMSGLPTPQLRRLNRKRVNEHLAIIGRLEGLGDHLGAGMRHLIKAGLAERRITWLAWGIFMPVVRRPPGSWAMRRVRAMRARRRGQEIRDWQADRP